MQANDLQVGGDHYKAEYQHWDYVYDTGLNYLNAQITRYISRWRKKNGIEDLRKALHYARKARELNVTRRNEVAEITNRFLSCNKVWDDEQYLFSLITDCHVPESTFENYSRMVEFLKKMINTLESRPVDPEIYDSGDEWRR